MGKIKFYIVSLVVIAIVIVIMFMKEERHSKYKNAFFWVLNKEKINASLIVWPNISDSIILNISREMVTALDSINNIDLKDNLFYEYQEGFEDPITQDEIEETLNDKKNFFKRMISKLESKEDVKVIYPNLVKDYQFFKSAGIFEKLWFCEPYVYFSEEFYQDFLPSHNHFVKDSNFFLAGDVQFKRYPYEKELLRDSIENLGLFMSYVPVEYAKNVLDHKPSLILTNNFHQESKIFYTIMEKVATNEVYAFYIELE